MTNSGSPPPITALTAWSWSVMLAVLFIVLKGYIFGISDHAEHLPQVLRLMDPTLFPSDQFVDAASNHFTVRQYYIWLMYGLSCLMPLSWAAFSLTVLSISLVCLSLLRITELFTNNAWSALLAPVLVLFVFYGCTVGLNHITYSSFMASTPAKALACFGLLHFFRGKHFLAGMLVGIAALFQVLVGLQLALVLGLMLVWNRELRPILRFSAAMLLFSAPMLVPTLLKQFGADGHVTNMSGYFRILFDFRNPHHYLPWHFPMLHYLKFGMMLLVTLLLVRQLKQGGKDISRMLLIIISGLFIYSVLIQFEQFRGIGRLQWFKTTVWITGLAGICLAAWLGKALENYTLPIRLMVPGAVSVAIAGLGVILFSAHIPVEKLQGRYMIGHYQPTDLDLLHRWIKQNLQKDAVFLTPPDDSGFRVEAQRTQYTGWQAIIHEPYFLLPWYERFSQTYGVSVADLDQGQILERAMLNYQSHYNQSVAVDVDYRIDNLSTCQFVSELGPILHQEGDWVVTAYQGEKP